MLKGVEMLGCIVVVWLTVERRAGAKAPNRGIKLLGIVEEMLGGGVVVTGVLLAPARGVIGVVPAARSGSKFRAIGRMTGNGVSAIDL